MKKSPIQLRQIKPSLIVTMSDQGWTYKSRNMTPPDLIEIASGLLNKALEEMV
jgi:hypothetical protein